MEESVPQAEFFKGVGENGERNRRLRKFDAVAE